MRDRDIETPARAPGFLGVGNNRGLRRQIGYVVVGETVEGRKVRKWGVEFSGAKEAARRVRQRERDERNRARRGPEVSRVSPGVYRVEFPGGWPQ